MQKWGLLFLVWLVDFGIAIVMGSKHSTNRLVSSTLAFASLLSLMQSQHPAYRSEMHVFLQVPFCGWEYWLLFASGCVLLLSFSYYRGWRLKRGQEKQLAGGVPRSPWDMEYSRGFVNAFFVEALLSGCIGRHPLLERPVCLL